MYKDKKTHRKQEALQEMSIRHQKQLELIATLSLKLVKV